MKSIADVWKNVLDRLRTQLSETTIDTWFDEVDVITMEDSAFVLHCSNTFKKSTIEARFIRHIKEALKDIFSADLEVKILNDDQLSAYHGVAPDRPGALYESDAFTFETYVVGPSNKLAYAAAKSVAEHPAENYNPLFIYGDSGLGKTHLMYAITNKLLERSPNMNAIYITGEDFTNQLIECIAHKENTAFREAFREKYRKADILLIDDIQFIAGKESTQWEFFHTFNALYSDHKQIILTSDRPPKEMVTLEERIRSRFEQGLIVDIHQPDYELRLAILKNKAQSMNLLIEDDVLSYIAEKLHSNIRQLEGIIKRISATHLLDGAQINMDLVRSLVPMFQQDTEPVGETADKIIAAVAKRYGVTGEDILGVKRTKDIKTARNLAMYIIRQVTDLSLNSIGVMFDRDHSTIHSNITAVEKQLKTDTNLENEINDIRREIKK